MHKRNTQQPQPQPASKKKKKFELVPVLVVLVLVIGTSKCNVVSFIAFTIIKLVDGGSFLFKIDADFVVNEATATAPIPINSQAHIMN